MRRIRMNPRLKCEVECREKGAAGRDVLRSVGFDGRCEVTLPGMRIVEGAKGTFVDVPSRQFKDVGFVPFYYLNKALRD